MIGHNTFRQELPCGHIIYRGNNYMQSSLVYVRRLIMCVYVHAFRAGTTVGKQAMQAPLLIVDKVN